MNKTKKRKTEYHVPRETQVERELLQSGIASGSSQLIRESTHLRVDGHARHSTSVVDIAGSTPRPLDAMSRPDVPREEGPVYDVLELDDAAIDPPLPTEEGRALRESVSAKELGCGFILMGM